MPTALDGDDRTFDSEMAIRSLVGLTVKEVERDLIIETLRTRRGNRTQSAEVLGVSLRGLRDKLHVFASEGVDVPPPPQAGGARDQL